MIKYTESASLYNSLEKKTTAELLANINAEDAKVANAVAAAIPQIEKLVDAVTDKIIAGGRLFYMGAGTSGRLGILDASECPPTYGVPHGMVIGLIAGGDAAIRKAVEFAEDGTEQGWADLLSYNINTTDVVVGIAASGTTPYVVGALKQCRANGITTACITCNEGTPIAAQSDFPIEVIVGPEIVTGSTRMKSGTAQKLVLNMISTAVMIKIGRVEGNRMVNMQLTNEKLLDRGTRMIQEATNLEYDEAKQQLLRHGSVKKAIENFNSTN
jgi:N-acetylmuramic acid 6-phosphate etherase